MVIDKITANSSAGLGDADEDSAMMNIGMKAANTLFQSFKCTQKKLLDCVKAFTGVISIIVGEDVKLLIDKAVLVKYIQDAEDSGGLVRVNYFFNGVPATLILVDDLFNRVHYERNGSTITLPSEEQFSSQLGYTFLGWSTSLKGDPITSGRYLILGNTSFYAQWRHGAEGRPEGVTAEAVSNRSIRVCWLPVEGARSYHIYRTEYSGGQFQHIASVWADETSYAGQNLKLNILYIYEVSFTRGTAESELSADAWATTHSFATLYCAEWIDVRAVSSSSIRVRWAPVDNALGYIVYRQEYDIFNENLLRVATVDAPETSYMDYGLSADTTYEYQVSAFHKNLEGGRSVRGWDTTSEEESVDRWWEDLEDENTRPYYDDDEYFEPVYGGNGTFTLIGIPSAFNGMYAMLVGDADNENELIEGFESWTGDYNNATLTFPQVNNRQVIIPLWSIRSRGRDVITEASPVPVQYTGSHIFDSVSVIFYKELSITGGQEALLRMDYDMALDLNGYLPFASYDNVSFSGGRASRTWGENTFNERRSPDDERLGDVSTSRSFGSWPAPGILAEYGLSGLSAPVGATNIFYAAVTTGDTDALSISFDGSQTNDGAITRWFTSQGWSETMTMDIGDGSMWYYEKPGFTGIYMRSGTTCTISSIKR